MSPKYVNSPNLFCEFCGEFTPKSQRKSITPTVKNEYELCSGCKVGTQDKNWTSQLYYRCSEYSRDWLTSTHQSMSFAVPMVWREHKIILRSYELYIF